MPKDTVALGFESAFSNEMAEADKYFRENQPELVEQSSPSEYKSLLRDTAREVARKRALKEGGFGGFIKSEAINRAPNEAGEIGFRFLDPGNRITEAASLEGAGKLTGGIANLFGFGENVASENPARAAGALAATGASFAVPPLMAARIPAMAGRIAGAVTRAEQVIVPVGAATGAGTATSAAQALLIDSDDPNAAENSRPLLDAIDDGLAAGGSELVGGLFGQGLVQASKQFYKFARGNEGFFREAMESIRLAGIRGEEVALEQVSDRSILTSGRRTIGVMPIPFIAARFTESAARTSSALGRARNNLFDTVSPTFSTIRRLRSTASEQSDQLLRSNLENVFRKVPKAVERYRAKRNPLDSFVKTEMIRLKVQSAAASSRVTALDLVSKDARKGNLPSIVDPATGTMRPPGRQNPLSGATAEHINTIANLRPGSIGVEQLNNLRSDIRATLNAVDPMNPLKDADRSALLSLEAALDRDIDSAIMNSGDKRFINAYTKLREMDSTWITLINGHVGNRARNVQTTFGREALSEATGRDVGILPSERGLQRKQGQTDMAGFLDEMLSEASPEEIRQFGIIMKSLGREGKEALNFAYARQLDNALERSTIKATDASIEVIKAEKIDQFIQGGKGPGGQDALRFWAVVDEAGVPRDQLRNFTKAAKVLWRQVPADTNQFVTRSVLLSGGKDLPGKLTRLMTAGLLGAGTGAGGAAVAGTGGAGGAALFGAFLLHKYSQLATSPELLQKALVALNPNYGTSLRQRALERIYSDPIFMSWLSDASGTATTAAENALNVVGQLPPFRGE